MPPKLIKLFCRNSAHCIRAEGKGGPEFKSSNSLYHHESTSCLFTKDGLPKDLMSDATDIKNGVN